MKLTIAHRGQQHQVELDGSPSTATLSTLQEQIESQTSIPVHLQKLLPGKPPKGGGPAPKIAGHAPDETLEKVGLQDGHKIMLLGVTGQELDQVNRQELKVAARSKPRQLHESLLRSAKPRNTNPATISPFSEIHAHPNFPQSTAEATARAEAYLQRLATDPGVLHVMAQHSYRVGILTELLPHEHPNLLGLNENRGQRISLRIRTDRYDGLRDYATSRRVLMHELAHNDVNDHPPEFKTLNSLLNAELAAFERAQLEGGRMLRNGEVYDPESGHKASGSGVFGESREEEEREERRMRILAATEHRLAQLESEIEIGCGNGGPNKTKARG